MPNLEFEYFLDSSVCVMYTICTYNYIKPYVNEMLFYIYTTQKWFFYVLISYFPGFCGNMVKNVLKYGPRRRRNYESFEKNEICSEIQLALGVKNSKK